MAATMHAKINRRKLDQIDIIRICEEILNPSVPMALRLSGILMGGVVIVYERKVRLLYGTLLFLLWYLSKLKSLAYIEINAAWKVKPAVDPTILPKGKTQAKWVSHTSLSLSLFSRSFLGFSKRFEAVTLPENQDIDLGDVEQSIDYSSKQTSTGFHHFAYFAMRLDTIDELTESFMESLREKEPNELHHQADIANITLDDPYDSHRADTGPYNHFERFDIEGDEETQFNIPSQEHIQIPTPICSPPAMQPEKDVNITISSTADDILVQHEEKQVDLSSVECGETRQPQHELQKRGPPRKRARRQAPFIMDDEQTMIPSNLYQSWLQDSSDISFRRPKIGKVNPKSTIKLAKLIELPPVALSCGLLGRDHVLYYPEPLLKLWMRSIQPPHDSPSGANTSPVGPPPSSSSPTHRQEYQDPPEFPMADFGTGVGPERLASTEKLRSDQPTGAEFPVHEFNLMFNEVGLTDPKAQTGSTPGTHARSFAFPSPDNGLDYFSNTSDSNSGRFNKKRPYSSSGQNGVGLESLDEENQWIHETAAHNFPVIDGQLQPGFKIPRRSQPVPTPEQELLVETARTQTQCPFVDEETETMTRNITLHLKTYFETPGAPQTESLNQLAYGMNRKQAAQLFYQTCVPLAPKLLMKNIDNFTVLATRNILKVQQKVPYGDIAISRGAKM
ncbi:hypothetical protein Cgig2_032760 [Carnegiea gigantea]|uniref:Uncharacterized protein n=1 Tax=Carnegiea gigantea TaxID=171969 RepID=A0A9Q1KGM5_9CARY|nr:hypothetical protein Cgig2_032760 [Carnegiea gigantea]